MKKIIALLLCCASFSSFNAYANTYITKPTNTAVETAMYRLNCGDIHVFDLNVFSDTDEFVGQEKDLTVSCYLIKHGAHWLLWDTGLPNELAEKENGTTAGAFKLEVKKTLKDQLSQIGLTPDDITHVGISHGHFDHTGNVNMFKNATLIIQKAELDFITNHTEEAKSYYMDIEKISYFLEEDHLDQIRTLKGDTDLFGDGTLKAITLPGHTPGHMALMVKLKDSGTFVLSGDQWHFSDNHDVNGVPSFNYDRADTLASSAKLNALIKNNHAKLIIQHEQKDVNTLPVFPAFIK